MKKMFLYVSLLSAAMSFAQQLPEKLPLAVGNAPVADYTVPDFSHYGKTYKAIFTEYLYTLDRDATGENTFYVGAGDRFFTATNFITDMNVPGVAQHQAFYTLFNVEGLYKGLKSLFNAEKDYSANRYEKLEPESYGSQ